MVGEDVALGEPEGAAVTEGTAEKDGRWEGWKVGCGVGNDTVGTTESAVGGQVPPGVEGPATGAREGPPATGDQEGSPSETIGRGVTWAAEGGEVAPPPGRDDGALVRAVAIGRSVVGSGRGLTSTVVGLFVVGRLEGSGVDCAVGLSEGLGVAGLSVGFFDGFLVGVSVGSADGGGVRGLLVGLLVDLAGVGQSVGLDVGAAVVELAIGIRLGRAVVGRAVAGPPSDAVVGALVSESVSSPPTAANDCAMVPHTYLR